jgi:hypothetical protein
MRRWIVTTFVAVALPSLASAQATRTWVSGVGDDVNPCSRTAPCKTFAGAISKTAAGGEIDALDPGGFGAVTITKSITIAGTGTLGSILSAGTNGVNVNDSATGTPGTIQVILRDISINGAGTGVHGVNFTSGANLTLQNVTIERVTSNGINVTPSMAVKVHIYNTTVSHAANGLVVAPTGGGAAIAKVEVDNSRFLQCSGVGVKSGSDAVVTVKNSIASGGGIGFQSIGTGNVAVMELQNSEASHNTTGVQGGGGAGFGTVRLSNCLVTGNGTGLLVAALGFVDSWVDNKVVDNGTNGAPNRTLSLQ